ncbi:MAG: RluA family pseudouridine synthase [Planctomycetes bacterium]|nr:RluA family pseudouridine synthase [Planctomycetota bacterium]
MAVHPASPKNRTELKVTRDDAGSRLDRFLRRNFPEVPLSHLHRLLRKGNVRVNADRARGDHRLSTNDTVSLALDPSEQRMRRARPDAEAVTKTHAFRESFRVVFEDASVLVADKPAGILVHPDEVRDERTMVHYLCAHVAAQGMEDPSRAAFVHRLDRNTSGLLLAGKDAPAVRSLSEAMRAGRIEKTYLALCCGRVQRQKGEIDLPLAKETEGRVKGPRSKVSSHGERARTLYRILDAYERFTLVEVRLETGRTHQIRAHLEAIGHPLVGDGRYGGVPAHRAGAQLRLPRIFLHACGLRFPHPTAGRTVSLGSKLPADLERVVTLLREDRERGY